jgi:hypothetical protein
VTHFIILATWEAEIRGLRFEGSLGKNSRAYLKNKLKAKRTGGVAQGLPSKYKALGSIPRTAKNN